MSWLSDTWDNATANASGKSLGDSLSKALGDPLAALQTGDTKKLQGGLGIGFNAGDYQFNMAPGGMFGISNPSTGANFFGGFGGDTTGLFGQYTGIGRDNGTPPDAPSTDLNSYKGRDTSAFYNALNTRVGNKTSQGLQDAQARMAGMGNYGADANAAYGRVQNQANEDLAQGAAQAADMDYQSRLDAFNLAQKAYENKMGEYNAKNGKKEPGAQVLEKVLGFGG